jgi:hypothetical protein
MLYIDTFIRRGRKKLRKGTTSFVSFICLSLSARPSVRPSVRMKQFGSHWTDFHEIWFEYLSKILL